ncbi:hypothetical protein Tco_0839256 [Tanacetum coccineum]|uniref:Uncharacterized protein n=1 Tax=Tanacetum coccineum TaxID=301880 RepID=A0ABQ5AV58_9ASTR
MNLSINSMMDLNQEQKDFQSQSKGIHFAGVYAAKMIRASSFSSLTSYMNSYKAPIRYREGYHSQVRRAKRSAFATEKENDQREGSRLTQMLAKLDSHSEALRVSEAL